MTSAAASMVLVGVAAAPAMAQQSYQFLPDDVTNPEPMFGRPPMIVGYANEADWTARVNGTSPRISYVSFSISTPQLSSYNGSVVSYERTAITGPVTAYDTSTVTVSRTTRSLPYRGGFNALNQSTLNLSGTINIACRVYAIDNATVNVSGATFDRSINGGGGGWIEADGNSTVNYSGGSILLPKLYGRSTMNISGGSVGGLELRGNATVNISGGTITDNIYCYGNSTVNITGGTMSGTNINASQSSIVNFSGGLVSSLLGVQDSIINITGGTVLGTAWAATVNVYGGTFVPSVHPSNPSFIVSNDLGAGIGVLNFFGTDLVLAQVAGDWGPGIERYAISGTLQDGSVLSNASINLFTAPADQPQPRIVLHNIPAPAVLPVAVLGLGALMGRRRR